MLVRYRQFEKIFSSHPDHEFHEVDLQFANVDLDGNFPGRDAADVDYGSSGKRSTQWCHTRIVAHPPKQNMSIDEYVTHRPSNALSNSSGNGSSKSSAIQISPFIAPGERIGAGRGTGLTVAM